MQDSIETIQMERQSSPMYPTSPFQVGDRVAFARRAQTSTGGMTVQEVDCNMFDIRIKVDYKWWTPASFIPYETWLKNAYPNGRLGY